MHLLPTPLLALLPFPFLPLLLLAAPSACAAAGPPAAAAAAAPGPVAAAAAAPRDPCCHFADAPGRTACDMRGNRDPALQQAAFACFLDTFYVQNNSTRALRTFVAADYVQHNPFLPDGREALIQAFSTPMPGGGGGGGGGNSSSGGGGGSGGNSSSGGGGGGGGGAAPRVQLLRRALSNNTGVLHSMMQMPGQPQQFLADFWQFDVSGPPLLRPPPPPSPCLHLPPLSLPPPPLSLLPPSSPGPPACPHVPFVAAETISPGTVHSGALGRLAGHAEQRDESPSDVLRQPGAAGKRTGGWEDDAGDAAVWRWAGEGGGFFFSRLF